MTYAAEPNTAFQAAESSPSLSAAGAAPKRGYLFGPLTDFLYLGGGSLFVLGSIAIFLPNGIPDPQIANLMTILMLLINQPHFAHSYQLFYRKFRSKAFGSSYAPALRVRYIFAGLVVPIALLAFLAIGTVIAVETKSTRALGYGLNLMFFLVGWHYVKQGYGILIVDSVQKNLPFSENAKRIFRFNAYACWLLTWTGLNNTAAKVAPQFGIAYSTFALPAAAYHVFLAIGAISTAAVLAVLLKAWRRSGSSLPWNGVIAYLVTLYLWVIFARINPLVYVVISTFHSLQYLTVVWRYQLNAGAAGSGGKSRALAVLDRVIPDNLWRRFGLFVALGILLGYLFMDAIPTWLDTLFPYDRSVFGDSVFLFAFLTFINVHHYALDSVIWRRGNPDVQQYVFRPAPSLSQR